MPGLWPLLLLPLVILCSISRLNTAQAACTAKCGSTEVKYPFGIEDGCGNPDFRATCESNSLQINQARVQSINYTAGTVNLANTSAGAACPFSNLTTKLEIQICNAGASVCITDLENCCLQQQTVNSTDGQTVQGCPLYHQQTASSNNISQSTTPLSSVKLLWSPADVSKCNSTGCSTSGGYCGYNVTNTSQFMCICTGASNSTTTCSTSGNKTTTKPIWLSGSLAIAVIVVVLVFGVSLSIYWKWKKNGREDDRPEPIFSMGDPKQDVENLRVILSSRRGDPAKIYTLSEIDKATNGFANDRKIGAGGFGTVYRGDFEGNVVMAVKRANHSGRQSSRHFFNEVSVLSQVNHRNLVRLVGCCGDTDVPILIYEYVPNGTLFEHLHKRAEVLSWNNRLRIAIETAEALAYLHSAAYPPIYHRDVKTANILLDNKFTAKVADFGLSRLVPVDVTHVSTMVQGTPGYVDPEYYQTYQLTDKSDVYSFGVVLLEMVTGRKPVDFSRSSRDVNLSAYSVPLIRRGMIKDIIDSRLEADGNTELTKSITSVADIAVACLSYFREERPTMKQVLEELVAIRGSSGVVQSAGDYRWLEDEVVMSDSFGQSSGVSNSSGSRPREQQSVELTPR